MYTYQVVGISDQNDRTYDSPYATYSKKDGFKLKKNYSDNNDFEDVLNKLMHEDVWVLKKKPKKMTMKEIEKALGYEVDLVDEPSDDKKPYSYDSDWTNYLKELLGL